MKAADAVGDEHTGDDDGGGDRRRLNGRQFSLRAGTTFRRHLATARSVQYFYPYPVCGAFV